MTTLVCSWLEQATADESTNESRAFDEVHFVSELVKERFDPQRADVVFSDGASVPTWLQDIIKDRRFCRSLLSTLTWGRQAAVSMPLDLVGTAI
eukprot:gene25332-30922_t